ncbi:biotin carboxyl carrier protein [Candidatus Koribacter versatilis Ellin345]|uniref:Biotin carboxyl carrier protein n=1 Tax=Koribacter versatilis (strain Ellin345) TaxID=204669 RepID=Q1IVE1_KORVE|nr:biotin/lipoyl-containing protein [Candidatus Koribacter versatilis]ABF39159.1 biotin carboxyl carrier protein [Candidatus Koribacter versatilis Ellin345]
MVYDIVISEKTYRVEIARAGSRWSGKIDGQPFDVDAVPTARDILSIIEGEGKAYEVKRERALNGELHMLVGSSRYSCEINDPRSLRTRRAAAGSTEGPQKIVAPMPGKVVRILVPQGGEVEVGKGVVVVEAMKMQNELKSPKSGKVQKVLVSEGATVNAGDTLAVIE